MAGVADTSRSTISCALASSLASMLAGILFSGLRVLALPAFSWSCRAFCGSEAASSAADFAGLSSRMIPTMMCRNCTLPASTQGRACSQNMLQYGQLGSLNR